MSYNSLADFLEKLAQSGELTRIGVEVDAQLEIAEITRRVAREGGPALLFDRVRGQKFAVVTNLLGTSVRVCRALEIESLDAIATRTEDLVEQSTPQNWFDRLKMSGDQMGVEKFRARAVKAGPCQQVVRLGRDIDLAGLPLVQSWPGESGPAITAGQVITHDLGKDARNVTICPLMSLDENRLAMADDGRSALARDWANHLAAHEKMPVVVVLGGDPAGMVAGSIALHADVDAFHLTGLLRGKAIDVVKCRTHALEVPADADLVLEGYLDPDVAPVAIQSVAPAAGYFRAGLASPVLHVTAITHRSHPIFPAVVDSGAYGEPAALRKARERMLLSGLRSIAPGVVDLHLAAYGGPDRFAFVAIRKTFPFQARQIASALWGSPAIAFTKVLIFVDADIDVNDTEHVLSEVGANVALDRDVFTYDGPSHGSDHSHTSSGLARHLGIDATAKIAGEQQASGPGRVVASDQIRELVTSRWTEYKLDPSSGGKSPHAGP